MADSSKEVSLQDVAAQNMKKAEKEINAELEAKPKQLEQTTIPGSNPAPVAPIKMPDGSVKVKQNKHSDCKTKKCKQDRIFDLLSEYCLKGGAMIYTPAGATEARRYPKLEAWKYLAELENCHTRVVSTQYHGWMNNPMEYRIDCVCELVDNGTGEVLSTVTACAASDEAFVKKNGLSAAYGLATSRAEARAVRSRFGHYMALVGTEMTPYEEMGDYQNLNLEEV